MTYIIIAAIAVLTIAFVFLCSNYSSFKDWLVYAVSESEQLFGGGTGKLKLRYAYDLAIKAFPIITKFISFSRFSKAVDEALDIMRDMLKHNEKINAIITDKGEEE